MMPEVANKLPGPMRALKEIQNTPEVETVATVPADDQVC
jgi:hypothetical protein